MDGASTVAVVLEALRRQAEVSGGWMAWNLLLAATPWLLALVLFRPSRRPDWAWLCLATGWLLLIPNAAYVLTDVIHLPAAVRREPSDGLVLVVVVPLYAAFFAAGFAAYADALRRLRRYVSSLGWLRRDWAVEIAVHAASSVGIYAGRIHRLNSWDVVRQPFTVVHRTLLGFTRPAALAGMLVTFVVLAVGHAAVRPVIQGIEDRATRFGTGLRSQPG